MRLLRLNVSERRGEPARRLDLGADEGGAAVVAITGREGSGKTSVLEAIALHKEHVAPYGPIPTASDLLGPSRGHLEIESEWLLEPSEQHVTGSLTDRLIARSRFSEGRGEAHADPALVHILARYQHDPGVGKVDLVPVARLGGRGVAPGDPLTWQRQHRLSRTADKYAGLPRLFADAPLARRQEVAALTESICPGLHLQADAPEGPRFATRYGDRSLPELSTSQRLAFELAATFVLVGLHHAVVLFDTPELGLPPGGAVRTVEALRRYAPSTQLVLATTDPALLALPEVRTLHLEAS